jgi:hypothetical protein
VVAMELVHKPVEEVQQEVILVEECAGQVVHHLVERVVLVAVVLCVLVAVVRDVKLVVPDATLDAKLVVKQLVDHASKIVQGHAVSLLALLVVVPIVKILVLETAHGLVGHAQHCVVNKLVGQLVIMIVEVDVIPLVHKNVKIIVDQAVEELVCLVLLQNQLLVEKMNNKKIGYVN